MINMMQHGAMFRIGPTGRPRQTDLVLHHQHIIVHSFQ